jgi:hypothetical protein
MGKVAWLTYTSTSSRIWIGPYQNAGCGRLWLRGGDGGDFDRALGFGAVKIEFAGCCVYASLLMLRTSLPPVW